MGKNKVKSKMIVTLFFIFFVVPMYSRSHLTFIYDKAIDNTVSIKTCKCVHILNINACSK